MSCIEGKSTHMCKTIQHFLTLTDPLHRQSVVLLIQEKSGFLTIHDIYQIMHAIFNDLYICIKCIPDKILNLRQSFFFPFIGIAALIHTTYMDAVCLKYLPQQTHNDEFELLHAKCQTLDN